MPPAYSAEDLARLSGLSVRTVRFYVEEGLLPPAASRGRGSHYSDDHLMRLIAICAMKGNGLDLERIRDLLDRVVDVGWDDVEVWADPEWDSNREDIPTWIRAWHGRLVERAREIAEGSAAPPRRTVWTRVEIQPGVELHVSSERIVPSPSSLERIASVVRSVLRVDT